jgi:flagellar basal body-associated protein FliL
MKKIILIIIVVLVIAIAAAFNVTFNSQKSDLSGVSLANVEALAQEITNPPDPGKYSRVPTFHYNPDTENLEVSGYCCYLGGLLISCVPSNC